MPTPAEILRTLAATSREMTALAVGWHVLLAFVVIRILTGWRPSKRFGASVLALPLLSVSALAWRYGNPFNGAVFAGFAALLLVLGLRRPQDQVDRPPAWAAIIGSLLILFGWVYPHFLGTGPWLRHLYAAPAGLIPCPTLSFAIGFALLAKGFSSRGYSTVLGLLGLFYGLVGTFRLGVGIDLVLVFGSLALLALSGLRESLKTK
jgi:hypothetical protein